MRVSVSRWLFSWAVVTACSLNPQPDPPSDRGPQPSGSTTGGAKGTVDTPTGNSGGSGTGISIGSGGDSRPPIDTPGANASGSGGSSTTEGNDSAAGDSAGAGIAGESDASGASSSGGSGGVHSSGASSVAASGGEPPAAHAMSTGIAGSH